MNLPEVTLGGVQDDVAPALQREAGQAQQLGSVVEQGLTQYGQAVVQTQTMDAHLAATAQLNDLDDELRTKKAYSPDELKARLGSAYDVLPDAIKHQPPQPVLGPDGQPVRDPATGEVATRPGDVPTPFVADALYQHDAQRIISDASQHITVGSGWQAQFQRAAAADVMSRWNQINSEQLAQAHQFQVDQRSRQALQAAYQGDFATAKALVGGSQDILGQDGQLRLGMEVSTVQQTKPVMDSLIQFHTDPTSPKTLAALQDASAALADPNRTGLISPERQNVLARLVGSALKQAGETGMRRDAAGLAFQIGSTTPDALNPDKIDGTSALKKLDQLFVPGGQYADRPELRFDAASNLTKMIQEKNAAATASFDQVAGQAMGQVMHLDDSNQPHVSLSNLDPRTRAALEASGKDGQEVIERLMKLDQGNQSRLRQDAQLPTSDESSRAFLIERSMALQPGSWRTMSGGQQLQVLLGMAPVPGEPDAPAVAVSSRDYPQLATKVAGIGAPPKPVRLTPVDRIAQEEAEQAFPSLRTQGAKGHAVPEIQAALGGLKDYLSKFVDDSVNQTGKEPADPVVRAEARRLLTTVPVRQSFFGIPLGTRSVPFVQAVAKDPTIPEPAPVAPNSGSPLVSGAAGAPQGAATKPAYVPGARVSGDLLGYPPSMIFEYQPNGRFKRVQ